MPKRFLSILTCGYILTFYSEQVFWARIRPSDTIVGYIETWLLYSLVGFAFLIVIEAFKVRSMWALFLCGAVFGWLIEGVIVQTTYESLPLSISFTALAWHALLSVWVGWYGIRKAIQSGIGATLKIATGMGLFYGLWAISWWTEPDQIAVPPLEFAVFAIITTLLLIIAYWIYDRNISGFKVGRRTKFVVGGLLLVYFIVVTLPAAPIALIVLPVLLLIVYVALRRNKQIEKQESLLTDVGELPPFKNYLAVLLMPLVAIVIYGVAYAQGLQWHINWIVYLITMPLGFLLLGVSLYKVWRGQMKVLEGASDENSGFIA